MRVANIRLPPPILRLSPPRSLSSRPSCRRYYRRYCRCCRRACRRVVQIEGIARGASASLANILSCEKGKWNALVNYSEKKQSTMHARRRRCGYAKAKSGHTRGLYTGAMIITLTANRRLEGATLRKMCKSFYKNTSRLFNVEEGYRTRV